ncbi:MAG TPA: hydrogen peroxide-inducible genes activator [Magnetovibrio sp.]
MYLPTIRQLQYLTAIVELGHFGQAAERCNVTQSTLSAGLKELENLLGAELVERTRRSVRPTALGIDIADKARIVLDGAREISEAASAASNPLTGQIRLGVIPTIGPFVLPRVLGGLRNAYPELQLLLSEEQTAVALDMLSRGALDVALLALPYDVSTFDTLALGRDPFWVAMPKGHALAKRRIIKPEHLDRDELLLLDDGHCLRDHALGACHFADNTSRAGFGTNSLYTMVEMVANGLGVTLLPEIALSAGLGKASAIELRPLQGGATGRELALVWRKSYRRDSDVAALGAYLRGRMAGLRVKRNKP